MTQPQAQTAGGESGGRRRRPLGRGGRGIPKVPAIGRAARPADRAAAGLHLLHHADGSLPGPANFSLIIQQVMVVGTLAIGQTLIILTAGIDLSCGTVMALGSIVMTKLAVDSGVPPGLAILRGIA